MGGQGGGSHAHPASVSIKEEQEGCKAEGVHSCTRLLSCTRPGARAGWGRQGCRTKRARGLALAMGHQALRPGQHLAPLPLVSPQGGGVGLPHPIWVGQRQSTSHKLTPAALLCHHHSGQPACATGPKQHPMSWGRGMRTLRESHTAWALDGDWGAPWREPHHLLGLSYPTHQRKCRSWSGYEPSRL